MGIYTVVQLHMVYTINLRSLSIMVTATVDGVPTETESSEIELILTVNDWSPSMILSSTIVTFRDSVTIEKIDGMNVTEKPSENIKSSLATVKNWICMVYNAAHDL